MTRQDWLTACAVAAGVALVTVVCFTLPMCWAAEPAKVVMIPALPPVQLSIPAIHAEIAASATPAPGKPVTVQLTVKMPAGMATSPVPVTVTVLNTTMETFSRSLPKPQLVAQAATTVPVGQDGVGTATVSLPLTWAAPAPKPAETTTKDGKPVPRPQTVTTYQLVLSSPLGGKPATGGPVVLSNGGKQ